MKKRFLTLILTLTAMLMCIFGLTACKDEHVHNYMESTTAPTCTEQGFTTHTCSCGDSYKDNYIDAVGHKVNPELYANATEHWKLCITCYTTIDNEAHTWNSGVIIQEATTTSTGIKTYTCSTCENIKTETLPMLPSSNEPIYALNIEGTEYVVVGFDGNAPEIVIPNTYNGLRVTSIYEKAFLNNTYVKKVTLPNTITSIGKFAFQGCINLTQINIPESVLLIDTSAFEGCSALNKLTFASEIDELSNALTIGNSAFKNCINLTSVQLAQYTETISDSAFENCYSLKSITINANLKYIGASAFAKCIVLSGITFNTGLINIGAYAFDECEAITNVVIPDTVKTVGMGAFRNAKALQSVSLSANMTAIANSTFQNCIKLQEIELHEQISNIGISAFSCCTAMKTVRILGDVSNWGNNAFYRCENLTSLYINSSVTGTLYNENYIFYNAGINGSGITLTIGADGYIPDGLFEPLHAVNAPKITSIIIENGATEIKYFSNYNYLPYVTNITIPNSVTNIAGGSFSGCNKLESITLPFVGASATASNGYNQVFGYIFGYTTSSRASSINGTTYQYSSGSDYYHYYIPNTLKTVVINGTSSISDYAFNNCANLTSIAIPSVTSIGDYAFNGCSNLTNISHLRTVIATFDYNYNGSTPSIVTLTNGQTLSRPTNPTRSGYVFTGWYTNSSCTTRYEFTGTITNDMTLYAGWTDMSMSSVYSENQINPTDYTSSSDYYSVSTGSTYSDSKKHIYLVVEETGIHYIYYMNASSSSNYAYYLQIYNLTTGTTIKSSSTVTNTSYLYNNFTCSKGDIIVISLYRYNTSYSSTAYFYFSGFGSPTASTATVRISSAIEDGVLDCEVIGNYAFYNCSSLTSITIADNAILPPIAITFNYNYSGSTPSTVTLSDGQTLSYPTVPTRSGYAFAGWYTNSSCTTAYSFSGTITSDITLYAKWVSMNSSYSTREYVDIANYNSSSSKKSVTISASNSSSPNYYYFTCYKSGSYTIYSAYTSGDFYITVYNATQGTTIMSQSNLYSSNSSKSASFTANTGDVIYVSLYKYNSSGSTSYGTFYVTGAAYPTSTATASNGMHIGSYAFYNCSNLTNVTIGDTVTSIGSYAFKNCSKLTSLVFSDTSTWYRTTSSSDWNNKTNGTSTGVTSSSSNATYFKSNYYNYYWYKL